MHKKYIESLMSLDGWKTLNSYYLFFSLIILSSEVESVGLTKVDERRPDDWPGWAVQKKGHTRNHREQHRASILSEIA